MTLVLGYMRGGSSLTGDIIRYNHGEFYIFEPLHGLIELAIKKDIPVRFLNGTSRRLTLTDTTVTDMMVDLLYNWFTCNLCEIDLLSLSNEFIHIFTPEHDAYYNCIQNSRQRTPLNEYVTKCLPYLQEKCIKAKTRTLKTIRFPMTAVETLLKRLPSLKVVHLVRDPRAILQSQLVTKLASVVNFDKYSMSFCNRMSENIQYEKQLLVNYPHRIRRLVYENLAINPRDVTKRLYDFLFAIFDENVEKYVKSLTSGPIVPCEYCTKRGNSTVNAFRWMKKIPAKYCRLIDKNCIDIYREVGYKEMSSTELNSKDRSWYPNKYQTNLTL
ncbi:carbohydrate sulfotransferase 2-like [Saccostrea echinata]|uniref:carbohydrate sulfotransferase 2-like n=1 Tax=Saccostrea echinata TaxID=191078 RepID=UPI002A81BB87|nr:carbohydrate sulfotransferase 2-like [Saccostrea echinata]